MTPQGLKDRREARDLRLLREKQMRHIEECQRQVYEQRLAHEAAMIDFQLQQSLIRVAITGMVEVLNAPIQSLIYDIKASQWRAEQF